MRDLDAARQEGGVCLLVETAALLELGRDDARVDGVRADAEGRQIDSGTARQLIDGALGGTVVGH